MTQHCHETVKKALIWATEASPWGGRFRNCCPQQHSHHAAPHLSTSLLVLQPCSVPAFYSVPLQGSLSPGLQEEEMLLHVLGIPSLLLSQPWLLLQDWTCRYGPASHLPHPPVHWERTTRQIWAARAAEGVWEWRERTVILFRTSICTHCGWCCPLCSPVCCSLGSVLEADMLTLISVWAKQFTNQLHCHSTIHN